MVEGIGGGLGGRMGGGIGGGLGGGGKAGVKGGGMGGGLGGGRVGGLEGGLGGVVVGAMNCNCRKSRCLKLYCECFALGRVCGTKCNCLDCCNNQMNEAMKKRGLQQRVETEEKKTQIKGPGCNCRKSHCKKKYCECFDTGKECSDFCKCEGCRNGFKSRKRERKEKKKTIRKKGWVCWRRVNVGNPLIFRVVEGR